MVRPRIQPFPVIAWRFMFFGAAPILGGWRHLVTNRKSREEGVGRIGVRKDRVRVRVRLRLGNECEIGAPLLDERRRLPLIDSSIAQTPTISRPKKLYISALSDGPRPSRLLLVLQSYSNSNSSSYSLSFHRLEPP